MTYFDKMTTEKIILEPEDWTEEEFKTIKSCSVSKRSALKILKLRALLFPVV